MLSWFYDLYCFIFPSYCPVCGIPLYISGLQICLTCEAGLPKTDYTKQSDNPVAQQFWGRVHVEAATALIRFEKGSKYQALLHQLKYKGNYKLGVFLGKLLGEELMNTEYAKIDFIVPVPLHKKKQKQRGYNQSEVIASGTSQLLGKPVHTKILIRKTHTSTQTNKSRIERWQNMEGVFALCVDPEEFRAISVLLLDDVSTTGATLEACGRELLKIPEIKIYIATLACA